MTFDDLRTLVSDWPQEIVAAAVDAALAAHRPDITFQERPDLARMIAMALADPQAPEPPLDARTNAAILRALQKRLA